MRDFLGELAELLGFGLVALDYYMEENTYKN